MKIKGFGKKAVITLLLSCIAAAGFSAELEETDLRFPNARLSAIGGSHAALADDITTLFTNPAGLASVDSHFRVSELTLTLSGKVFNIANLIIKAAGGADILSSPETLDLLQNIHAGIDLVGPIYFGFAGDGLGFGLYNQTGLEVSNTGTTTLSVSLKEKILLNGGYGFSIPLAADSGLALDIGLVLKSFVINRTAATTSLLQLQDFLSNGVSSFLTSPFYLSSGFGIDAGMRLDIDNVFAVGLTAHNIYSPYVESVYQNITSFMEGGASQSERYGLVPFYSSIGLLFTPDLSFAEGILSELRLMLDYRDIFGFLTHPADADNIILNFGLGAEIVLLDVLSFRGGFSEGLFSAGFGIDLGAFKLHTAMFGSELSPEPGLRPVFNVIIGLEFRS